MKEQYLIATILFILVQMYHTWYSFDDMSTIENKFLRNIQNTVISGLIGYAIVLLTVDERHKVAILFIVLEVTINLYYYSKNLRERSWRHRLKNHFTRHVFAVILPICVWLFAYLYSLS